MSIVVEEAPLSTTQVTENQEVVNEVSQAGYDVQEETQLEPETPQSTIPEKYAGKTLEDVIEMHQNAERVLGKQGMEVGEQRKLIESLSSQQQATEAALPKEEPVPFEEQFYADPANAVNSAIENHPDMVQAKQTRVQQNQSYQQAQLESAHPDFMTIVEDKGFQDWIGASKIRQEIFRAADSYDFESANELFSTWKQISSTGGKTEATNKAVAKEKSKREQVLRKTTSETRSSGDSVGGKKVYRRADLINLKVTDPRRYDTLADEIQQAYIEGRVK